MTASRAVLYALFITSLSGCRTQDRDRVPVVDETGENEDCPGCLDVAYMMWHLQGALHEGGLHPVNTSSGERPAQLSVVLVSYEYKKTVEELEAQALSVLPVVAVDLDSHVVSFSSCELL